MFFKQLVTVITEFVIVTDEKKIPHDIMSLWLLLDSLQSVILSLHSNSGADFFFLITTLHHTATTIHILIDTATNRTTAMAPITINNSGMLDCALFVCEMVGMEDICITMDGSLDVLKWPLVELTGRWLVVLVNSSTAAAVVESTVIDCWYTNGCSVIIVLDDCSWFTTVVRSTGSVLKEEEKCRTVDR